METVSDQSFDSAPVGGALWRLAGRPDLLTAQKVEVGLILQAMLGTAAAAEYMNKNAIDPQVAQRVLNSPEQRRGRHDAFGIRC